MRPKNFKELLTQRDETDRKIEEVIDRLHINCDPRDFSVGEGWLPVVTDALIKLIDAGWDRELERVKQKFCELRIYISQSIFDESSTETTTLNKFGRIIEEAVVKCDALCEVCGGERVGRGIASGMALCANCGEER